VASQETKRMPVSRVLSRMLVPEREEVTGGWRKLHTDELQN
jgi:hypothetical protein